MTPETNHSLSPPTARERPAIELRCKLLSNAIARRADDNMGGKVACRSFPLLLIG